MSTTETQDIKELLARELERSRGRSLGLTTEVLDEAELTAQHSTADVAVGLGSRPRRQLRGAVAAPRHLRCAAAASRDRPPVRRVRAPAGHPAQPPAAEPGRVDWTTSSWSAARCSTPSTAYGWTTLSRCWPRVSSTGWCSSTSTSTTRRCWPPTSFVAVPVPCRTPTSGPPPRASHWPAEVLVPAGPFVMGTSTDPWALDNERPARRVDLPGFFLDTTPVSNAAYRPSSSPAATTTSGCGAQPAGSGAVAPGSAAPPSGSGTPAAGCVDGSAPGAAAGRGAGAARLLLRGRRLRPLGRSPPAHRGRVGEGGVLGPGHRDQAALPLGRRRPGPEHANLGQSRTRPAPVGSFPAGASAVRGPAAARRRLGVDLDRLHRPSRLLRLPVPGVLRGVLRHRLQGAAWRFVGHRPAGLPRHLPQLGLPDPAPDLRRIPYRARTRDRCAGTWPTSGHPITLAELVARRRRTHCSASRGRRAASGTASSTPTASAPVGTCPAEPSRSATGGPSRSGPTPRSPPSHRRSPAAASWRPSAPPPPGFGQDEACAAPFLHQRWLFSHNGRLADWPPVAQALDRPDVRHPRGVRAGGLGAAVRPRRRPLVGRRPLGRRAARCCRGGTSSAAAGSPCWPPTAPRSPAPASANRCSSSSARAPSWSPPSRTTTTRGGPRCPTARWSKPTSTASPSPRSD